MQIYVGEQIKDNAKRKNRRRRKNGVQTSKTEEQSGEIEQSRESKVEETNAPIPIQTIESSDLDENGNPRLSTPPSPPSLSSDDIQSKIVTSTERSKVMMVEVENVNHIPFTSNDELKVRKCESYSFASNDK